ncbi:hypothetical protein vBKpMFBKp34_206 [Klebsiella phage vB_KpM_FBKp34]|nr:hypothetical protein vBKpMFBKp34_206 [Klebsiella phage vB_KpM_FBKp34]
MKRKKVFGVGVNDSKIPVSWWEDRGEKRVRILCPYYVKWTDMLRRCYSEKQNLMSPWYDSKVHNEWHIFSNFKSWMEKQDWEGKHLDKDILGDKSLYSKDTCVFVPYYVNNVFQNHQDCSYCTYHKRDNKYQSSINWDGRVKHIGYFDSKVEAQYEYFKVKILYISGKIKRYFSENYDSRVMLKLIMLYNNLVETFQALKVKLIELKGDLK